MFQKIHLLTWAMMLLCCPLVPTAFGQTDTNVVVSYTLANPTPLNLGFAGFATEMTADAIEYYDPNFEQMTASLSPGWLRYPAGSMDDAFMWTNGVEDTNVFSRFPAGEQTLLNDTIPALPGKGGAKFTDFATLCNAAGGARIVVCINGFTDTNTSAGAFAKFALTNHIPVAVWELCNEPYSFTGNGPHDFFLNSTDYVAQMKPYYQAIKAADSNAVVAIYFSDFGNPDANWDSGLANYPDKYWDAVVFHQFPQMPANATFAQLMALDNWQLASNTTTRVLNYLMPMNKTNVIYLNTAYSPAGGNGQGGQNPPTDTLFGGIYDAEYLLRLSTIPQISFVGDFQLANNAGINWTNGNAQAVVRAYDNGGGSTNTAGLPFGYYLSAQVCGPAVANWALTRSIAVYTTTVGTNCPTVPVDTNGIASIPAIYAEVYQGGNGKRYAVLTNKGSNAVPVEIALDGTPLTHSFLETFVTGADPSATNAPPPNSAVQIQTNTVSNPIVIPEYSVVRLEWTVTNIPSPTLALTLTKTNQNLFWSGQTNVVYNVQGVTNLLGTWTTLGRVANSATIFSFTNWNAGPQQFYRLAVP